MVSPRQVDSQYVTTLIRFVIDEAKDEKLWSRQVVVSVLGAAVLIIAALIALFGKAMRGA